MEERTWYSLNLMRFVFSIIVVLFHVNILKNGYISVEFFFFLSGAFLYKKVNDPNREFNLHKYMKSRIIGFLPYTTITIFGTALIYIIYNTLPLGDCIRLLERALLESTLLDGFGIVGQSLTLSTGMMIEVLIDRHLWYIMCLVIMTPFAVLFFKAKDKTYLPFISLMLYGILEVKFGSVGEFASYEWTWIKPCIRTLAGLLLGGYIMSARNIFCFYGTKTKRLIASYIALACSLGLIIFDERFTEYNMSEYLMIILFTLYLIFTFSTKECKIFEIEQVQKICNFLGKLSLGIYCYHPMAQVIFSVYFPTTNITEHALEVIVFSILLTLLTLYGIKLIKRQGKKKLQPV